MNLRASIRITAALALMMTVVTPPVEARAQAFDFGQIEAFESLGSGELQGGEKKTIVDDDKKHTVFFTILEGNADIKASWKSLDGTWQTKSLHGFAVTAFQVAEEFKIEAVGDEHQTVKYGYLLVRLKKQQ